jgi:hypothetical protein
MRECANGEKPEKTEEETENPEQLTAECIVEEQ